MSPQEAVTSVADTVTQVEASQALKPHYEMGYGDFYFGKRDCFSGKGKKMTSRDEIDSNNLPENIGGFER